MTRESKENISTWYKRISDPLFKAIVTTAIALAIYEIPKFMEQMGTLTFSTVEDRVNTENHVRGALNPIELHELKEHIGNPDFHMPKKDKDSTYMLRSEHKEYQTKVDKLLERQAVTIYQLKEEMKEYNLLLNKILRNAEKNN